MEIRSTTRRLQEETPLGKTLTEAAVLDEKSNSGRNVRSVATRSGLSRASKQTLRRRAVYEAEVQLAKIKEELITKKLALDLAEINDENEDDAYRKTVGTRTEDHHGAVEQWLMDSRGPLPLLDTIGGVQVNGGPI